MRSSRVLVVARGVDALTPIATALRERGHDVSLATGVVLARERARATGFDVVVADRALAEVGGDHLGIVDELASLPTVPPPVLFVVDDDGEASETRFTRTEVDRLAARIGAPVSVDRAPADEPDERADPTGSWRCDLAQTSLGELLAILAFEARSGALSILTAGGAGELRLADGDVVDAVYVRLEGTKAITRLLPERDGTATFSPGAPAVVRRIDLSTGPLLAEATTLADRATELRHRAGALLTATLVSAEGASAEPPTPFAARLLTRLRVPAALDALLDELPEADAEILDAVLELVRSGRIEELARAARVPLCGADQIHLVRASAERAKGPGFEGPARLVFAATATKLAVLGSTVLSLADARPPLDSTPALPIPHALSTLRLGEGIELDVVALPLVPAYAPLWPMAIAGAVVVVRVDEGAAHALEESCASVGVPILDVRAVFGVVDASSAVQVASLIRTALEADVRV